MKITTIPRLYHNVNRARVIVSVLSKYGLADWISQFDLDFVKGILRDREGEALARHTRERRIRMALAELGPTFIKIGQLLSTRGDVVGVKLADELRQLQDDAPADAPDVVRGVLEAELGQPVDTLFDEFNDTPLASASIGQVHCAKLKTGERIVVKVQHVGIEHIVREDLDILAYLAQLAEHIPEFSSYRPVATVAELQRAVLRELDFGREERNLQQFSTDLAHNPNVHVPRPYTELCTPHVLTMEMLDGVKLSEPEKLKAAGFDLEKIAHRGCELYLHMIFTNGCFHADPHPGNLVLLPNNVIGLLDFGMVGRIEERLREEIEEMLLALVNRDSGHLTSIIMRVGSVPSDLDESALATDVADFVDHYGSQTLTQFDLSGALNEMTETIRRYRITLPVQVAMLIKVLITLEGTAKLLSPKFNIIEVIEPMQRRIILRRLSPARHLKKLRRFYGELEHLADILPRRLMDIVEQVRSGKFNVHLDHRGLEPSVNRLVLGLLTSALFLGSALMLSQNVPPLLFQDQDKMPLGLQDVSILGLLGCLVSLILGLRLLWAIGKSGHLDRRK